MECLEGGERACTTDGVGGPQQCCEPFHCSAEFDSSGNPIQQCCANSNEACENASDCCGNLATPQLYTCLPSGLCGSPI